MKKRLRKVKNKLFYLVVEKSPYILEEYQQYKWSFNDKKENKFISWLYIINLNVKYRILRIQNIENGKFQINVSDNNSTRKGKLPYLKGSESLDFSRPKIIRFAINLLRYDTIIFSVFDTMIFRPFPSQMEFYKLLEQKHSFSNFQQIRIEAEKEARKKVEANKGNTEVNLYEIYEIIERKTGLDKNYGIKVELETERELCFVNPYIKEVYNIVKSQGKRVLVISDTYHSKEFIVQLLNEVGYYDFDDVIVSNENNANKKNMNLFKVALQKHGGRKNTIIHVGSDFKNDIVTARKFGMDAQHYKSVHSIGNKFRASGMSEPLGSIYRALVNIHLHNGTRIYNQLYEYGFIYGGLYILGYCQWVYSYVKKYNIDKVIFISNSGKIYSKAFNLLYNDVENDVIFWSDNLNEKCSIESRRYNFLDRLSKICHSDLYIYTIGQFLDSQGLNSMCDLLSNYKLNKEDVLHTGNYNIVERFIVDNWEHINSIYSGEEKIAKDYFMQKINGCEKVAIVDIGDKSSIGDGIKYLNNEKWKLDCEIHSLKALPSYENHLNQSLNSVYLFSELHNRDLYEYHYSKNKGLNSILFELFNTSDYPIFSGFQIDEEGIKFKFEEPLVENHEKINDIENGIVDFIKQYTKHKSAFKLIDYIPGYDAYMPFKMAVNDLRYFKNDIGEFYLRQENAPINSTITLNDLLQEKGL